MLTGGQPVALRVAVSSRLITICRVLSQFLEVNTEVFEIYHCLPRPYKSLTIHHSW